MDLITLVKDNDIFASELNDNFKAARIGRNFFGDGSDGDVLINTETTLTEDKYYNNLTIDGVKLHSNGYKIYVKNTLEFKNGGWIECAGSAGLNGTEPTITAYDDIDAGVGGDGGSRAYLDGSLPNPANGADGANGGVESTMLTETSAYHYGNAGEDFDKAIDTQQGGAGGYGGNIEESSVIGGGEGGTTSYARRRIPNNYIRNAFDFVNWRDSADAHTAVLHPSLGGGSGGSGEAQGYVTSADDEAAGASGGAGGSGGGGGIVFIAAKEIITEDGIEHIVAIGGNGGDAASGKYMITENTTDCSAGYGGSGGGAGGPGGVVFLIYHSWTGTGEVNVSGGTGGSGSTGTDGLAVGVVSAPDGQDGFNGPDGQVFKYQV